MSVKSLSELLKQTTFSDADLTQLLTLNDPQDCELLYREAYERTTCVHGNELFFRGLVEISNVCTYDCRYCGIRKSNRSCQRYSLSKDEILDAARYALNAGYASVALQSGERDDPKFIDFITDVVASIHQLSVEMGIEQGCGMTLSFGEQTPET